MNNKQIAALICAVFFVMFSIFIAMPGFAVLYDSQGARVSVTKESLAEKVRKESLFEEKNKEKFQAWMQKCVVFTKDGNLVLTKEGKEAKEVLEFLLLRKKLGI